MIIAKGSKEDGPQWKFNHGHPGIQWRFVLLNAASKTYRLEVRQATNHANVWTMEVGPDALNQVDSYLPAASFHFVQLQQEQAERLRERRLAEHEARFRREIQERDVGEPVGEAQANDGEARGTEPSSTEDRGSSPSGDSPSGEASSGGLQAKPEAPARKASPRRKGGRPRKTSTTRSVHSSGGSGDSSTTESK